MFHALVLVEVENGSAEYFLEAFFEVAFINGHFAAEFLDGNRIAYMLDKYFTCPDYFFPVGIIIQEFTGNQVFTFFPGHAFHAVEQQDLRLGVNKDIFEAVDVIMVQQRINGHPHFAAEGKRSGKGCCMPEIKYIIRNTYRLHSFHELRQVGMFKAEAEDIHRWQFMFAIRGPVDPAIVAIHILIPAISISQHTEPEFHMVQGWVVFLHMVYKHAGILCIPLWMPAVTPYGVFPGARDLLLLFGQQFQFALHNRLFVGNSEDIVQTVHYGQRYDLSRYPEVVNMLLNDRDFLARTGVFRYFCRNTNCRNLLSVLSGIYDYRK